MIPIVPVTEGSGARHSGAPGSLNLRTLPPLALYVHFPWCVRKCPYCDFNSHEPERGAAAIPEREYLQRLARGPRERAAANLGAACHQRVHRRRHAQSAECRRSRHAAVRPARAAAARSRVRDHARGQSRYRRIRPLRRVPHLGSQSAIARRAVVRRAEAPGVSDAYTIGVRPWPRSRRRSRPSTTSTST